jgi:GNAT superfamily N-acetyltransferase
MNLGGPQFRLERLDDDQRRAFFRCSREPALESYLRDDARGLRENARSVAAVHVLLDTERDGAIAGFFTLSNTSVIPAALPKAIQRKLSKYDHWPATLLGRMARHDDYAEHDLGTILLGLAFEQHLRVAERSAALAMIVDAKNPRLATWYTERGFTRFPDQTSKLFVMNQSMSDFLARVRAALKP